MHLALGAIATAAVFLTAGRMALAACGIWFSERLLLFGGLVFGQAVLTQLAAGTLLRLTPGWVAALNVGLAALAWGVLPRPDAECREQVRHSLHALRQAAANQALAWVLLVLALVQVGLVLWTVYVLPPQGWDEWWYHLPPIARWVADERVSVQPEAAEWQDTQAVSALGDYERRFRLSVTGFWANVYPLNTETAAMWSLLFLRRDRWVEAVQLPLVLLGSLAVYGLTRWARVGAPGPLLAALLWALLPINQMQARTAYTDTAVAALTLGAILFFLRWAEGAGRHHFLSFALLLGLAVGIKPSALAYAAALGLLSLLLAARRVPGGSLRARARSAAGHALILALAVVLFGGFWYLRTWIRYGNPVYPFSVSLLGRPLFAGLGSVESLIYVANTPEEYLQTGFFANLARSWFEAGQEPYSFYTRTGGFGAIWAVIGLPALAAYALRSFWRRDGRAIALFGLGAFLLIVHTGGWWPRYSILVPGVWLAAAGWLLAAGLRRPLFRQQLTAMTLIAVLWSLLRADASLVREIPVALKLRPEQRTIGRLYLGDLAPVEEQVPEGERIGYAPMTFIYPLYGPGLERRVEQVDGRTSEEWRRAISEAQVSYVTALKGYGPHYRWAQDAVDLLEEMPTEGEVALFAVRR